MWKLSLPSFDDAEDNIITAFTLKGGRMKYAISPDEINDMLSFYASYEKAKGTANASLDCKGLADDFLKALKSAYSEVQEAGRLTALRDRIFINAKTCPCCGILAPDELDHHLPVSKYAVYAIYSSNLVPSCHKCNNKKRTVTGLDPAERFIHVYYDEVPQNHQFLFCDVSIVGQGLVIKLRVEKIPELSDQMFLQLSFQMEKVGLNNRLMKELNLHLSGSAAYIQSDYEVGGKIEVRKGLLRLAGTQKKMFGINHWRSVMTAALADHEEFCDGGFYEPLALTRPD
jgi:hypothetical protein